jgi:hypothetical protein
VVLARLEAVLIAGTEILITAPGGIGPRTEVVAPPVVLVVPAIDSVCHDVLRELCTVCYFSERTL